MATFGLILFGPGNPAARVRTWLETFVDVHTKDLIGFYRVFHGFGKAKFPDGGLVFGSSQFSLFPDAAKNDTQFKSGQIRLENNHLALSI